MTRSRSREHSRRRKTSPQRAGELRKSRRPVVEKLVAAANQSSYWYERFPERMQLEPWQLAYDYMTRSGRMTDERLQAEAPEFFPSSKRNSIQVDWKRSCVKLMPLFGFLMPAFERCWKRSPRS